MPDYNGFSLLFIEAHPIIDHSTKIFFACLHQKRGYVSLIFSQPPGACYSTLKTGRSINPDNND